MQGDRLLVVKMSAIEGVSGMSLMASLDVLT
jgi:hypothetical protein